MKVRPLVIVTVALLLFASRTWAHPPHESSLGTFQRHDGNKVEIVGYYVDGIVFADPVSVRFRSPNCESLAGTSFSRDAAIRKRNGAIEVYQFESIWLPFASRIQLFDGVAFRQIDSKTRFLLSPLFHVRAHFGEYTLVLVALIFSHWAFRKTNQVSGSKFLKTLQKIGLIAMQLLLGLLLLGELMAGTISPILIALAYGFLFVLWRQIKKRIPRSQKTQEPSQI